MSDEEHEVLSGNDSDKENMDSRAGDVIGENHDMNKQKKRKRLLAELSKPDRCGICFLSRIPPHMDPSNLRQILSQYGDIKRIYLAPEGGRKRSSFYYDLWNIKYLSKFKWDDLTGEIAYKNAVREQKLALEIAAAKRERDFYLSKVDKSRALSSIEKRMKKKQKMQQVSETKSEQPINQQKIIRHFAQTKLVADTTAQSKSRISKDILVGVFGGSS